MTLVPNRILLFLAAAMLSALIVSVVPAHSQSTRPVWVVDPAREYLPEEYLVGVGSGEFVEAAIENARADLAAGFRAHVHSVMRVEDNVAETFGREGATFERATQIRRSTEVETSECLANVTLGGTWFDETAGRYHALVFINRDEAQQTIGADIQNRLTWIGELLDCDGCYPDVIAEYAGVVKAVALHREYEQLSAQLRVMSEGRAGEVDSSLGSRVAVWFADASSRLTLTVGAVPPELAPSLRDALLNAGFAVVDEYALFTAELIYSTSPAPYSELFVFENWEMSLRIRRTDDGSEVVSLNKHDRTGHKSREAARERCLRMARKALSGEFSMDLEAFLADQQ